MFEWTTDKLGSQSTVCAGGRYDGLVKQLGGTATPAVGFALGIERLLLLVEEAGALPAGLERTADVYLAVMGDEALQTQALLLGRELRQALPDLGVLTHCGGGKYNAQLKKAYALGALCAVILEGEGVQHIVKVRILADNGTTVELAPDQVVGWVRDYFNQQKQLKVE